MCSPSGVCRPWVASQVRLVNTATGRGPSGTRLPRTRRTAAQATAVRSTFGCRAQVPERHQGVRLAPAEGRLKADDPVAGVPGLQPARATRETARCRAPPSDGSCRRRPPGRDRPREPCPGRPPRRWPRTRPRRGGRAGCRREASPPSATAGARSPCRDLASCRPGAPEAGQHRLQTRKLVAHDPPHELHVHVEVRVDDPVPQPRDLVPRRSRRGLP